MMKLKKIFAGMAASAIAMSAFAMSASALDQEYNVGLTFQMADTWAYRDPFGGTTAAVFPDKYVITNGGAAMDTNADCGDAKIQHDGDYTISIKTSGTINSAVPGAEDNYYIDEAKTLTREGSPWSMLCNYEPDEFEEGASQDSIQWVKGGEASKFNMLLINTDIPVEYDADKNPTIDGRLVKVTNLRVDMCGAEYTADEAVCKNDMDTLSFAIINTYGDSSIDAAAMPADDGTITVTFTIEGLDAEENNGGGGGTNSDSDSDSDSGDNNSNSNSGNGGSGNGGNGGSGNGGTSGGGSTSTATDTAAASDNTENAEAGAPAGIALALAAVAGAAVVVTRKKN